MAAIEVFGAMATGSSMITDAIAAQLKMSYDENGVVRIAWGRSCYVILAGRFGVCVRRGQESREIAEAIFDHCVTETRKAQAEVKPQGREKAALLMERLDFLAWDSDLKAKVRPLPTLMTYGSRRSHAVIQADGGGRRFSWRSRLTEEGEFVPKGAGVMGECGSAKEAALELFRLIASRSSKTADELAREIAIEREPHDVVRISRNYEEHAVLAGRFYVFAEGGDDARELVRAIFDHCAADERRAK